MADRFPIHDESNAPDAALEQLTATREEFGMIPNLEGTMALAPPLLKGYGALWDLFDETSFSPVERQVVYQTANFENECDYCVPWHTLLSRQAKMDPEDVAALRAGGRLGDPKLEALRVYSQAEIRSKGKIAESELAAFFDAGWEPQQALEVVLGIATKVLSNYTNSIAGTPLDAEVQKLVWHKPTIKPRTED